MEQAIESDIERTKAEIAQETKELAQLESQ
jgi:hypothetical protein